MNVQKVEHALKRMEETSGYIQAAVDQRRTPDSGAMRRWSLAIATNAAIIRMELNLVPAAGTVEGEHNDLR
jgi:hypothetical protein